MWREMAGVNESYELRDPAEAYEAASDDKNEDLRRKIAFFLDNIHMKFHKLAGSDPRILNTISATLDLL
jgi:hypothetical protein